MNDSMITNDIKKILDCIFDIVTIADAKGKIVYINKSVEKLGWKQSEIIGKTLQDLITSGYMKKSVIENCLRSGKKEAIVHTENDGYYLNWAVPLINDNNEISYVVSTEWELSILNDLQDYLIYTEHFSQGELNELNYYRFEITEIGGVVAKSIAMNNVLKEAHSACKSDIGVLIQGESGTGKGVIAKYIHFNSGRALSPFIQINCGSISANLLESELFGYEKGAFTGADAKGKKGLFELANKGTLFLDEIGEIPLNLQAKLLQAIEDKTILRVGGKEPIKLDIKIIAATNVDLEEAVKRKEFRSDLYYRLNVLPLKIPPLRERKEDIEDLVYHFCNQYSKKYHKKLLFDKKAIQIINEYDWPGNARELGNIIERLFIIMGDGTIEAEAIRSFLPKQNKIQKKVEGKQGDSTYKTMIDDKDKELIEELMPYYESAQEMAKSLKMDKSTLNRKIKKFKIKTVW
jgi:PAS domain S-box-containing protein